MLKRPSLIPLIAIFSVLGLLAIGAWFYTNANDPVAGLPETTPEEIQAAPTTKEACDEAGGVWNECASACPPGAEACIQMCVQKCEGIGDGRLVANAYFPNSKLDPKHLDCSVVFPVKRAIGTGADGSSPGPKEAIEALLKGLSSAETADGYFTTLPEDVALNSLTITSGVAHADFSKQLNGVAGSCRVGAIRAQIEQTLKQFEGVTSVVISVNGGNPDEALQP